MAEKQRPVFETRTEMVDVTYGGLFGGTADTHQVMAPGITHFYIDGREVTKDEYERRYRREAAHG